MFDPSTEYSPSRPFKIYISLLDKWEIGQPLTEVLVYDAFKAAKRAIERGFDTGDDVRFYQLYCDPATDSIPICRCL